MRSAAWAGAEAVCFTSLSASLTDPLLPSAYVIRGRCAFSRFPVSTAVIWAGGFEWSRLGSACALARIEGLLLLGRSSFADESVLVSALAVAEH